MGDVVGKIIGPEDYEVDKTGEVNKGRIGSK